MKMKKETVQKIADLLKDKKEIIQNHKEWLVENAEYNSLETRLAFDCYHSLPTELRLEIRKNENLKDSHIETGMKKVLKDMNII